MARRKNKHRSTNDSIDAPTRRRAAKHRKGSSSSQHVDIFGIHSAAAALTNPDREILEVLITANAHERLSPEKAGHGSKTRHCDVRELDERLGRDTVHQGVLVRAAPLEAPIIEDIADALADAPSGFVLVLDQVTDPHNVGAILRSAAVFGARALIMTQHHSPSLSGALAKTASGGLEHVPVCLVPNLARALETLRAANITCFGLDGEGEQNLASALLPERSALVMGSEDKGLRRLTRENCDMLVRIPAPGAMRSLNVSNAAAVALSVVASAHTTS